MLRDGRADGLQTREAVARHGEATVWRHGMVRETGGVRTSEGAAGAAGGKAYLDLRPRVWRHKFMSVLAFLSLALLSQQVSLPHAPARELNCCAVVCSCLCPPSWPAPKACRTCGGMAFGGRGVGVVRRRKGGRDACGICVWEARCGMKKPRKCQPMSVYCLWCS